MSTLLTFGDAVADMITAVVTDPDEKVRLSAALNLGKAKDVRAYIPLASRLGTLHADGSVEVPGDPDANVRFVAVSAIGALNPQASDGDTITTVVKLLLASKDNDSDPRVRAKAAEVFATLSPLARPAPPVGPQSPPSSQGDTSAPASPATRALVAGGVVALLGAIGIGIYSWKTRDRVPAPRRPRAYHPVRV